METRLKNALPILRMSGGNSSRIKSTLILFYRQQKDYYPEREDAFFLLHAVLKKIYLGAASLNAQMALSYNMDEYERLDSVHLKQSIVSIREMIGKLKAAIDEYTLEEPRDILEALKAGIAEIETVLSMREVASYFSVLETDLNYSSQTNDKNLFNFLNNRSDAQKEIDHRAARELSEEKDYRHDPASSQDLRPYQTELMYRMLFKKQNPHHPVNAANGANTRRIQAASIEMLPSDSFRQKLGSVFKRGIFARNSNSQTDETKPLLDLNQVGVYHNRLH